MRRSFAEDEMLSLPVEPAAPAVFQLRGKFGKRFAGFLGRSASPAVYDRQGIF
jgi:hypothetical protein